MNPPLLILAAGLGTRLAPLELGVPKALVPVNQRPFLEHQLEYLQHCGFRNIVIAISRPTRLIEQRLKNGKKLGINITYSREVEPQGTGRAILRALRFLGSRFYVVNGDTAISFNPLSIMRHHVNHGPAITIAAVKKRDVARYGSVLVDGHHRVLGFHEKGHHGSGLVSSGVLLCERRAFLHPPKRAFVSLERDLLPPLVAGGGVEAVTVRGTFWDIGTPASYRHFQALHT